MTTTDYILYIIENQIVRNAFFVVASNFRDYNSLHFDYKMCGLTTNGYEKALCSHFAKMLKH